MVFPSKVDAWLVVVVIAAFFLSGWAVFMAGLQAGAWWPLFVATGIWVIVGILIIPTSYMITPAELIVRGGLLMRKRVPLHQIISVLPSSSALASPAWSLDRLEVRWGEGRLLISPRDQQRFLDELRKRVPELAPVRGGVARTGTYIEVG